MLCCICQKTDDSDKSNAGNSKIINNMQNIVKISKTLISKIRYIFGWKDFWGTVRCCPQTPSVLLPIERVARIWANISHQLSPRYSTASVREPTSRLMLYWECHWHTTTLPHSPHWWGIFPPLPCHAVAYCTFPAHTVTCATSYLATLYTTYSKTHKATINTTLPFHKVQKS